MSRDTVTPNPILLDFPGGFPLSFVLFFSFKRAARSTTSQDDFFKSQDENQQLLIQSQLQVFDGVTQPFPNMKEGGNPTKPC